MQERFETWIVVVGADSSTEIVSVGACTVAPAEAEDAVEPPSECPVPTKALALAEAAGGS
jgi:hypothetical protein